MSKLFCRCGRLIRISGEVPNPREWKLVADEALHGHHSVSAERLAAEAPPLVRCPACERLWIYWRGVERPPTEYVPAGDDA